MITQSEAIVLVIISFLLVGMVYSSIAQFHSVSAKPKITQTICSKLAPTVKGAAFTETCCQFIKGGPTNCNSCQYDSNGNQVGNCTNWTARQTPGGNSTNPPSLGTVLPPSGNNTGTPGKTSIFNPIRNTTNALPGNSSTSALPPGSIFKVPPGTTNTQPTGNNTGALPALTITKEHNPASPNILSLAGNATNPSNSTSPPKFSPLTGQHLQTSGHHQHKGGSTSASNTNSTGH